MAKDHPTGQSGLYQAFLQLKTPEQCYRFLQDVCSYSELSAMEQRYNIAEMLVDKRIYTEIMDKTGASSAIISRVSRVLSADDSVLRSLLEGRKATAHAGFQDQLAGAEVLDAEVVVDGNITTSYGLGGAIPFALELVRQLAGQAEADRIRNAIAYRH